MTSRMAGYSVSNPMPERRKVFRVEKMATPHGESPSAGNSASSCCEEVMRELAALRAMLVATPLRPSAASAAGSADMAWLMSRLREFRSVIFGVEHAKAGDGIAAANTPIGRFTHELEAAVKTSEQATQRILTAAEEIDQAANNLSAAVKGNSEQGLAQDIRDRVIAIFEACNFQDVTSQRLAKVSTALAGIDNLIGDALSLSEFDGGTSPAVHEPPLGGDDGHASQSDVDLLFAGSVRPALVTERQR
jgi:chemotaxis protein CheZ